MNSLHRLSTAKGAGLITRSSYLQMVGCPQLKSRIYDRNLFLLLCAIRPCKAGGVYICFMSQHFAQTEPY